MQKFRKRTAVVLSLVAVTALFAGGVAQAEETEAVQTYGLEAGVSYDLDLDGDGTTEQFVWQTTAKEFDDTYAISQAVLDLYVNDSQPSSFIDDYAYMWRMDKGTLADGRTLLFAMSIGDNDYSEQVLALTESEAGLPFQSTDLVKLSRTEGETADHILSGWARGVDFVKSEGDLFTVRWFDTLSCAGIVSVDLDYQIDGAKITQVDQPGILDETKTWTAWQSFSVKTDVESDQEAFAVAPGDTVSLFQVVLRNGTRWILCENANGEEGWFADPDSAVWEEQSDGLHWGYFDEAHFAG
ncbi:MAG: hypothetical protein PUA72_00385 [Lachnospiraceae bacterium]|nr:hypothetical protein [Lachnospiraceae bacterium]